MKISLKDSLEESLDIDSNDPVIAIDDTGHEEIKDPNPLIWIFCLFIFRKRIL